MRGRDSRTEPWTTSMIRGLGYEKDLAEPEKVSSEVVMMKFWSQEKCFKKGRSSALCVMLLTGKG